MYGETRRLEVASAEVELTHQEFELLRLLLLSPDCVLASEWICDAIWGTSGVRLRKRLAVVVSHLRAKLLRSAPYAIECVRCRGYGLTR